MGKIKAQNSKPVVSRSRRKSTDEIIFSIAGIPTEGEYSGRYFPGYSVTLGVITVSSRTTGNNGFYPTDIWLATLDPGDSKKTKMLTGIRLEPDKQYNLRDLEHKITLNMNQWLGVVCLSVGGHEDIVVTVQTSPSSDGYVGTTGYS